ncbi:MULTISPECIES: preprotein translocase subunit YajC [Flavobacterium]|jgi:preprotein translocase subunit YajC|uniref:Sec translocon accessory complex subunit YajC n=1 Tax=Flavobacterium supellecticarium TaxID=2565924 RepID=A0A4S4A2P0_9FLAO|nr:preprotein translocase subunit YajC [Flavobacterium supellecticarium]MPT36638.1 preprotein translocase subunit YajC [Flavobacterium sp.]THF52670.1 preprotein translocase subunit YajC [Flavobacterium supellecticarium]HRB72472.1 preprotein translocase subunit YajC [Flavobacterium sp.]
MEQLGQLGSFLPIILMFVVVYFLMIRPQQTRQKKEKEFESNIKVGDKIVTKAGIHGKIAELYDDSIVVETMAGKIKMERSAISMELSQKVNAAK